MATNTFTPPYHLAELVNPVTFPILVRNVGEIASGGGWIDMFRNNLNPSAGMEGEAWFSLPPISAGGVRLFEFTFWPNVGDKFTFFADTFDQIAEAHENNNTYRHPGTFIP